jgi:hypothetical protein
MRVYRPITIIEAKDVAATTFAGSICIGPANGDEMELLFPDRTPRDKLEAIAKAINDALDAAREIEGAARD